MAALAVAIEFAKGAHHALVARFFEGRQVRPIRKAGGPIVVRLRAAFLRHVPGGHFKFPHLWPGQTPPGGTTGMDGLLLGLVSLCKAVGGFFEPVAFAAEFDEDTAVQEAVQNGGGQRGVAKEFVPIFHDPV